MRKLLLFISLFLSLNSQTNSLLAENLNRVNNTTKPNYKANTVDLSLRKQSFDSNWLFSLKDNQEAKSIQFDDSSWRIVNLPHDWSIEGNIDVKNAMGNDGGYFPDGIGWYRKQFFIPKSENYKEICIYFEGVYMNSELYVNGKLVGKHPYGYSSFTFDITSYIKAGEKNLIAVRVDNSQQKNCRWYSGSGIYRHVWLMSANSVHIPHWSTQITSPSVDKDNSSVKISSKVANDSKADKSLSCIFSLLRKGVKVAEAKSSLMIPANSAKEFTSLVEVKNPELWSPGNPALYDVKLEIIDEKGKVADTFTDIYGIKKIEYDSKSGLRLNGKSLKLNGGCAHHDNGILGAAAFDRAEVRRVELLKEAGFNAVRTSHNIPSEAFLYACDSLGLLVIDEAFDGWRDAKNKYDYSTIFDKWWKEDIESMVLRDRNHPSIFCWSIGNEVIERKKLEVVTTAHKLATHIRSLDGTRPVTSALASWDNDWEIYDPLAAEHDIVGYNYLIHKAESDHERVPSRVMMQTESYPKDAFSNWCMLTDHSYIVGDFVWTALDYLGESGIGRFYYDGESAGEHYQTNHFPYHGGYCGDIDILGWRKPISHYRQLLHCPDKKIYIAVKEPDGYFGKVRLTSWSVWPMWESWNWPGHEGKDIDVELYSHSPLVALYLNDKLIDKKSVDRSSEFKAIFTIPYQEGTLKAVGMDKDGNVIESTILKSAGKAASLRLTADRSTIKGDGQDLSFITVEVVDKDGVIDPNAEIDITASIKGGTIQAIGNASLKDTIPYVGNRCKTWKGRAMIVVRADQRKGYISLTINSELSKNNLVIKKK